MNNVASLFSLRPRRAAVRVIALSLAMVLCGCLPQGTDSPAVQPNPGDQPLLTTTPSLLDFGQVARASRAQRKFSISNPGNAPVTIDNIETSCECLNIVLAGSTVAPGQNTQATASLDLNQEASMTGRLRIEVKGHENGASRIAFSVLVDVNVEEVDNHSEPGAKSP